MLHFVVDISSDGKHLLESPTQSFSTAKWPLSGALTQTFTTEFSNPLLVCIGRTLWLNAGSLLDCFGSRANIYIS